MSDDRAPGVATLADVAREAQVSTATVSRYFNTPGKLAPQTRERVGSAVRQLGYIQNFVAGGLASNNNRLIAIIVPSILQSIFSSTIQAMIDELSAAAYSVILGLAGAADEAMDEVLMSVLARRPDGVILTGTVTSPQARAMLRTAGVPVIETWDLPDDPIDRVVGFSHRAVGRAVGQYVLAQGRTQPLLISADGPRASERRRGFADAFLEVGLPQPPSIIFPGATTFRHGRDGLARHLDTGAVIDAVVCSSDWSAHGVLAEAGTRGIRVPGEMSVVGFGDLNFAADTLPPLTTVRIDGAAVARETVGLLLRKDGSNLGGRKVIDMGFEIVKRDSC